MSKTAAVHTPVVLAFGVPDATATAAAAVYQTVVVVGVGVVSSGVVPRPAAAAAAALHDQRPVLSAARTFGAECRRGRHVPAQNSHCPATTAVRRRPVPDDGRPDVPTVLPAVLLHAPNIGKSHPAL